MIRLITDTGGRPVKNEDLLQYLQNIELWEGFLEILGGGDPIIVTGVEITDLGLGNYTYTAGIVYFDGSLCTIETGETSIPLPRGFNKVVTNINPREFFDGVTKDTATNTTLVQTGGGAFQLSLTIKRLDDYMRIAASDAEALAASLTTRGITAANLGAKTASNAETQAGSISNKYVTPAGLESKTATTTRRGIAELATEAEVLDGLDEFNIVTSATLAAKDGGLKTTVLNIGDWNMDVDVGKNVTHGLTAENIREISVIIRNDGNDLFTELNVNVGGVTAGSVNISSTEVQMIRTAGGFYDSVDYDSTSFNRGWITIRSIVS